MERLKRTQKLARTLIIAVAITTALSACSAAEESKPSSSAQSTPEITEPQKESSGEAEGTTIPTEQPSEQSMDEARSLEEIATEDAEKYMDALKKEDAQALSGLMAHAENEYTPEIMKTVIDGFRLQFDKLADVKLTFESNQQTEEYYLENFAITGVKEGKEYSVPFQVKYSKIGGIAAVQQENNREPLFDSPLIGQYPHMVEDAERYLQALAQKDVNSLAIHLRLDESTDEAKSIVQQMLKAYAEKLDLATTKVIPLGYDENKKLFLFELRDGEKQTHNIQVDAADYGILDDWASVNK